MSQNPLKSRQLAAAATLCCELIRDLKILEQDPESCRPRWDLLLGEVQNQVGLDYRYKLPEDAGQFVDTISDFILRLNGFTNPVILQNMREKFEFYLSLKKSSFDFSKASPLVALDPWFAAWEPQILTSLLDTESGLNVDQKAFCARR